ncbi:peptide N-acetyl-beta-D-glucosaminyl asparaginase amidase A-domain-containing protein [Daldinia bambusicola]|nr:peptide N-acetyl-beta-D-glucosaminyl asparaginase amidase A-domain-containing protein [Daldinia bambusicola]
MKWALLLLLISLLAGLSFAHPDARYPPRGSAARGLKTARSPLARFSELVAEGSDVPLAAAADADSDAASSPLECFQVAEPVLTPQGPTFRDGVHAPIDDEVSLGEIAGHTIVLFEHSFANSYGAPYVGNYTPPDFEFDHVVINFTVLVRGRQYDRTGVFYLGDTEVWRTSTAEPTSYGIRWVWLKDLTPFTSLWKAPQTVIFDLENIVDNTYTGPLNTTLSVTFFKSPVVASDGSPGPADLIIPISERTGSAGQPSQFTYPQQNATNTISFPRNANRAVFTVDVKAQGNEEFWWSNVPESAIHTFDPDYGTYPGYSPWREVQVLIDGQLAGVSWPFPVIYTGGVVPQLHRPIVGIEAFDIREHEIDITPWLPLLSDGKEHTFTIQIVGLVDDGKSSASLAPVTNSEWYITGKIFVWLDDEDSITTGELGSTYASDPSIAFSQRITQNSTGFNETLDYTLAVTRTLSISSYVKTQNGEGTVTWTQSLSYSNNGGVSAHGNDAVNTFGISGADAATGAGLDVSYSTSYSYPLYCSSTTTYLPEGNLTLRADLNQSLTHEVRGASVFPNGLEAFIAANATPSAAQFRGSVLSTSKNGSATYYRPGDNSYSSGVGQSHQIFSFGALNGGDDDGASGDTVVLYYRDVSAFNDTITDNYVEFMGKTVG